MSRDVDQVDDQVILIEPEVVEGVAPEFTGRQIARRNHFLSGQAPRQNRRRVARCALQLRPQTVGLPPDLLNQGSIPFVCLCQGGDVLLNRDVGHDVAVGVANR